MTEQGFIVDKIKNIDNVLTNIVLCVMVKKNL